MYEMTSQFFSILAVLLGIGVLASSWYANHLKGIEAQKERSDDQRQIEELRKENRELLLRNSDLLTIKTDELKELSGDLKTLSYQMYRSYLKKNTPEITVTSFRVRKDQQALEFELKNNGKLGMNRIRFLYRNAVRYYVDGEIVEETLESENGRVYIRADDGEEFGAGESELIELPFLISLNGNLNRYSRIEIDTVFTVSNNEYSTSNLNSTLVYEPGKRHWSEESKGRWPTLKFRIL